MECPKCGRKAVTTIEICFYCGHNMNEAYNPEVHDKVPAALVEEPARIVTEHKAKDDKNKTSPTKNIITTILSLAIFFVVIYQLINAGGIYKKYFGHPKFETDTEWAAYEISLIQKAEDNAMKDIMSYMDFQQLVDTGYLRNLSIESYDATRIVTAHGIYELGTENPQTTYLMYADTQDGSRSWTIDQDSKDQYEALTEENGG